MKYQGRTEQDKASIHRKQDAEVLRVRGRWRGAMYLMGYAVECSLKAKLMERYNLWTLRALQDHPATGLVKSIDVFTHSLHDLMEWTHAEHRMTPNQRQSWGRLSKWSVDWRYSHEPGDEQICDDFFDAASDILEFVRASV